MNRLPAFIERALQHPILPKSAVHALVQKAQAGDKKSRDSVVHCHLRYVYQLAYKHSAHAVLDDMAQEGIFGLLRAIDLWSPDFKTAFTTYAQFWVKAKMLRHFRDTTLMHVCKGKNKGASPVPAELFISIEAMTEGLQNGYNIPAARRIMASLVDQSASPEEQASLSQARQMVQDKIRLLSLPGREQQILGRIAGNEQKLVEIGDRLGISRERVRQLETRLKKTLHRELKVANAN